MTNVPLGAAFDCSYGSSNATSIIDLRSTSWHIDTRYSQWLWEDQFSNATNNTESGTLITDASYVHITATGGCGEMRLYTDIPSSINSTNINRVLSSSMMYIAVLPSTLSDQQLCRTAVSLCLFRFYYYELL
jgi:hypothetical protein